MLRNHCTEVMKLKAKIQDPHMVGRFKVYIEGKALQSFWLHHAVKWV